MKKPVKVFALSLIAAASMSALSTSHAQSSVTLWGRVVGGLEYIDNIQDKTTGKTNSLFRAAGNQWGTSMFGLRGEEKLSAGTKAIFNLESGFNLPNSALNSSTNALFNRRAYVGLSNVDLGTLTLGKNLLITNDIYDIDPTGQQTMSTATLVRGRNWQGADNMVEYRSPNMSGFSLGAQVSLSGQTMGRRISAQGLSVTYQNQDLMLRGIYSELRDATGRYSDVYSSSKDGIVGATYRIGAAKLFAGYERIVASGYAGPAPYALTHTWLGLRYDVTPQLTLVGAAYRVNSNLKSSSAILGMIGADYNISKRTFLYASLGGVGNGNNANYAADVGVDGPGAGKSQRVIYTGMGHSF